MAYDGSLKFDTKINGDGFQQGVKDIQSAAKTAMTALGAAVGVGAAAILHYGSEMESAMAKTSTLVGGSVEECAAALDKISGSLEKTASITGKSAASLADAAYEALSAGVSVEAVGGFVDKAAKLAIGGFTDTKSAVDALTSVTNAYGSDVINVDTASKILMQTQNKGKTTIDELAHSIAQVTPTAAAMKVSFDQVGASLATITAQGVPTAQATTQLNQLFAELGKSGTIASDNLTAAAEGTEYAGKSFSELMAEGVPLSDLLLVISDYAGANGKSMLDMFGSIESGRAALSLVTDDGKAFTSNLADMSTQADVVADAYEKMMDTVAAKKDVFIESAKNLATAAYDYIEEPLEDAADTAIECVQRLLKAVQRDGDKIVEVLLSIAKAAAAVVSGFVAFKVAKTVGNLIDGLKRSFDTAQIALTAYTAAMKASAEMESRGISIGGLLASVLKAKELAVGAVTGQITLSTAATNLWNIALKAVKAHPVVAVATAVALVTAAIVALTLATANQKTEAEKALETANARIKSAQDEKQAFYDLCAAQAEVAAASLAEIDSTERLAGKLQALTSETGFVDDANRGMAEFILGELNEALGTEYSMRDGQIDQYQTLQSEIWKTIDAKRAEALLAANEPIYLDAIKNRAQAQKDAAADYIAISQTKAEMANLEKQHIQDLTFMDGIRTLGTKASSEQILALQSKEKEGWYVNLLELQKTMDGQQLAYDENASKIKLYNDSIKSYDDATAASQNKNFAQCESLLSQQSQNYEDAKNNVVRTSEETMRAKGEEYAVNLIALAQYLQNCKDGNAEYDAQYFETLRANAKLSYQEAEKTGAALVDGQITGIDGKKIDLNATIEALRENGVDIMRSGTSQWWALGEDAGMGYANGLASTYDHIMATAASILNVGKNLGAKAPKSSGPVRRDSGARSVVANGRTSGMESSNSPTAPSAGEMAAFSAGTAATGVSSDTTSTATGVSSGFGAAGIRAIPHLSAAQTASINAQMRAAVFAQQNAVAARVSAQAEYQIVQHQSRFSESLAPALGNQIAGAVAAAMPKEIKTQTSIVLDGRAVFQGVKKAEANYGYNVGGLQNEW